MSKKFHRLTNENRISVSTLLRSEHSKNTVAKQLRFHQSTIYREIAGNSTKMDYLRLIVE